MTSNGREI